MADQDLAHEFGARVRKIRRSRGWTQEQLAEAADIGMPYVSDIERGVYAPNIRNAWRIAQALGCPIGALFPED